MLEHPRQPHRHPRIPYTQYSIGQRRLCPSGPTDQMVVYGGSCRAAVLFFLVTNLHIWKWLRWDDMQEKNPKDNKARYWAKLTFFSLASGGIGLMNTMTFPTANTGWHNSMYIYVYQRLCNDLVITSIDKSESLIRAFGGFVGCMLAVVYEWIVVGIEDVENAKGWYKAVCKAAHIVLYTFDQHEHALKTNK